MRVVLFGAGATGARIARILNSDERVTSIQVTDSSAARRVEVTSSLGSKATSSNSSDIEEATDLVVVATPMGSQIGLARKAIQAGTPVVTTTCETTEVQALLSIKEEAQFQNVPLIISAGFMPGLTCLLARFGADGLSYVDEIHVAKFGTGGPACARQHHKALSSSAIDWRDGRWVRRIGGSGRELCWFPEPVGGLDCYRGGLPDALLLVSEFSGVCRVTARMAATRRDRFTAFLPMLRRPHPEGLVGAIRVEVRGWKGTERKVLVFGVQCCPAEATAIVAASTALHVLDADNEVEAGARGLAGMTSHRRLLLSIVRRGLRLECFEGA